MARFIICSHSDGDLFKCEDNMLFFSRVKISSFRAKAYLDFYWCLYNKCIFFKEDKNPSSPSRNSTYDLPITSSDAPPLSYRRVVGAKDDITCSLIDPLPVFDRSSPHSAPVPSRVSLQPIFKSFPATQCFNLISVPQD